MDIDDIFDEKKDRITKRYKEIVDKLGFEPKDYEPERPKEGFTENDNRKSPFAALSLEELLFLRDYGFLS